MQRSTSVVHILSTLMVTVLLACGDDVALDSHSTTAEASTGQEQGLGFSVTTVLSESPPPETYSSGGTETGDGQTSGISASTTETAEASTGQAEKPPDPLPDNRPDEGLYSACVNTQCEEGLVPVPVYDEHLQVQGCFCSQRCEYSTDCYREGHHKQPSCMLNYPVEKIPGEEPVRDNVCAFACKTPQGENCLGGMQCVAYLEPQGICT